MAIFIAPEMKRVPPGATREQREQMFQDYKAELARLNPHLYNADGTPRSLWGCLRYLFGGR